MKQDHQFIVPKSRFRLVRGVDHLTSYRFGTRQAEHLFCALCGVQSFNQPRSNPDCYGVNIYCVDVALMDPMPGAADLCSAAGGSTDDRAKLVAGGRVTSLANGRVRVRYEHYDGRNWECSYAKTGIASQSHQ